MSELIRKTTRKVPVYGKMRDELKSAIASGALPPKSQILSESELCERYGISRVSVRTGLAELENAGMIVKKNGLGAFVCDHNDPEYSPYSPTVDIAVNLNAENLNVSWYYSKIYQAASKVAPSCNAKLSVLSDISTKNVTPALYQGVLAISSDTHEELELLSQRGIQIVKFNRRSYNPNIASVYVDYYEESRKAVNYLLSNGHRKIAIFGSFDQNYAAVSRLGGYLKAMNMDYPEPELFCEMKPARPDAEYSEAIEQYLKTHRPDALYLPFGSTFMPFVKVAQKLKLRIPEDLAIISFDDIGCFGAFCDFPFQYIKMPLAEMTIDAITYLAEKIKKRDTIEVLQRRYSASLEFFDKN